MLFLHQKVSIIALFFFIFFSTSSSSFALTPNSSEERIYYVKNEIVESNKLFDDYLMFSVVLTTGLLVFVVFKLRNQKRKEFYVNDKLLFKIAVSRKKNEELDHHLSLVHTLHKNLTSRLNEILLRLRDFKLNISPKQEDITSELDKIIGYAEISISKFKQSVSQFNTLK